LLDGADPCKFFLGEGVSTLVRFRGGVDGGSSNEADSGTGVFLTLFFAWESPTSSLGDALLFAAVLPGLSAISGLV